MGAGQGRVVVAAVAVEVKALGIANFGRNSESAKA